ncbi:MAG TPA: hypothetical protein VNT76_18115, partial [Candidatus Binatus sp.]|nr:hypothetical protein [Candidatus Binatus sp.]
MESLARYDFNYIFDRSNPRRDRLAVNSRAYPYLRALFVIFVVLFFQTLAIANTRLAGRAPGNPQR